MNTNDREGVDAGGGGNSEELGAQISATVNEKMAGMMDQFSSMLQGALSGGRDRGESSGDGGAPEGGSGDVAPASNSQRSAAQGMTGRGGYVGGLTPQGETAASGRGVGGYAFGGGSGGFGDGGTAVSEDEFAGGGISIFLPSRITPCQFKGGASKYPGWKKDFIVQAGFVDLGDVFLGRGRLPDINKPKRDLLNERSSQGAIQQTFVAWDCLSSALTTETDKAIIRRCKDPREALQQLDAMYLPETQGAVHELFEQFQAHETKPNENPITSLNVLFSLRDTMRQNGGPVIDGWKGQRARKRQRQLQWRQQRWSGRPPEVLPVPPPRSLEG